MNTKYNFDAPPAINDNREGISHLQAIMIFFKATRCGLRESRHFLEQNLQRVNDGGFAPGDVGDLICAWYKQKAKENSDD